MAVNFNLDLLYQLYRHDSSKGGTLGGLIDASNFNQEAYAINGNQITITEADGDVFTYDLNLLSRSSNPTTLADLLASEDPVGTVTTPKDTNGPVPLGAGNDTEESKSTTKTKEQIQAELDALKAKREALEQKIKDNGGRIEELQKLIDQVYGDIEKTIGDYIDQAEDIAEDIKEQVKKATEKHIEKYKKGEYDSTKSLHNAIAAELEGILSANAMQNLTAELERVLGDKKAEVEPYIAEIGTLEGENEQIQQQITDITAEEAKLEEEKLTAPEKTCDPPPTEPQGFAIKGDDGSITQFDFFVDRDGNNGLTDSSEFLGAQGFVTGGKEGAWSEMTSLDTNGDGFVDIKELDAGNVKVVKTTVDANGNKVQEAMSASDAFGKNADLKISTTQNATTSESDVPVGFNQFADNTLLGNFDVTLNGETYTGYQTADSMDYLNENYNFTLGSAEGAAAENDYTLAAWFGPKEQFKYDIKSIVDKVDVSDSESDLMEYAEEICVRNGINFSDSEKEERMIVEEIRILQGKGKNFDIAA